MADGSATGIRATYQLSKLGFRRVELSAAAEDANTIDVTCQLTDLGGNNVSEAARAIARVVGEPAADYTLAESGDGAEVSVTGHTGLLFTFASDGDATITVTDVSGASGESVTLEVYPVDKPMLVSTLELTFD